MFSGMRTRWVYVNNRLRLGRTFLIAKISHSEDKNIEQRVEDSPLVAVESSLTEI